MAISEARKRANKKWREANRDKERAHAKKSTTKNYILDADEETLLMIKEWINEREINGQRKKD